MNHLQSRYKLIFNQSQIALLDKAVQFASQKHQNQKRYTGELYITHPIAVAHILLDLGLDHCTIAAAIMHDCLEDTTATIEEITQEFGAEICELVVGVTKLDKISYNSKEEEQAENFRKMFIAMAKDIRVVLIKLADRLHNMRTIDGHPTLQRKRSIAQETLEIYAPLASRLGLSYLKCELEDLCLKVLEPEVYATLAKEITLKRAERKELVNKICARLTEMLVELGINGEVSGRPKHFYSIYKKMKMQGRTFEQIYDLTAVRVIVPSEKDCYSMLGTIHTAWKPMPGRFKDYISLPKPNKYQSLHTTVMTSYGMPFEIQIRTPEMHKVAEYGIAAHWKYKENRGSENTELDNRLGWLRGVMDVNTDVETPTEFYESLKLDLFADQVFIFTPKGDVVVLPNGSTPVDFAYAVHSEVGNKCIGAKINNKIVPLEAKISTGDYVEILTSSTAKGPSRDWLRFAKSSQAKTKIRNFFKKEMKEENIKRGKEMLELEAKHRGYVWSNLLNDKWLNIVNTRYSISSLDDLYASVGYGGFTVNQILLKLIEFYDKDSKQKQKKELNLVNQNKKQASYSGVLIKGQEDLLVHLAKCCRPVPGDNIIGFISRGRGIAVHRQTCPNLKNTEQFRLIEASWLNQTASKFVVTITVEAKNSAQLMVKISTVLAELKHHLVHINLRLDKNGLAIVTLGVEVEKTEQIDVILRKIQNLSEVTDVYRSNT